MKCIILAAGYATRMYPLTQNFPKPLLKIGRKPILEWILDDVNSFQQINEIGIVTNDKFISVFEEWKKTIPFADRIRLLNDGSTENENRLGAVKDMAVCMENMGKKNDYLVIAGDNLVDFSFQGFVDFFFHKRKSCIMIHKEDSVEKLCKTGVAVLDNQGRLLKMQEKPDVPASHYAVPPFYVYAQEDIEYILQGIEQGCCKVDAPGNLIQWLCTKREVYAWPMPGRRYDIGDLKTYEVLKDAPFSDLYTLFPQTVVSDISQNT